VLSSTSATHGESSEEEEEESDAESGHCCM